MVEGDLGCREEWGALFGVVTAYSSKGYLTELLLNVRPHTERRLAEKSSAYLPGMAVWEVGVRSNGMCF